MIDEVEKQRITWMIIIDYIGLHALMIGLICVVIFQDWILLPLNDLPVSFWLLYAITCITLLMQPVLLVMIFNRIDRKKSAALATGTRERSLLPGLMMVIAILTTLPTLRFDAKWDGGQLLFISFIVLSVLDVLLYFGLTKLMKRNTSLET